MSINTDRRIRKTKKALKDGLIELLLEKNIKNISVRELTEKVDLNRRTFYLHYKDIFDLLEKIEDELFLEFNTILDSHNFDTTESPLPLLEDIFTFLKDNAALCTVLLSNNSDLSFMDNIKTILREKCFITWQVLFNLEDTEKFYYYYNYILSGCIGIFDAWLKNGLKESSSEMASLTEAFILNGVDGLK